MKFIILYIVVCIKGANVGAIASWIMSILGIVVIGTLFDIFLSEKKLGKMVRSVFASLLVLVIITPIPSLLNTQVSCEDVFRGDAIKLDENFLGYANRQKINALEAGVESAFAEAGYKNVDVVIDGEIGVSVKIHEVKVIISNMVIDNPSLNINKVGRVAELCAEFLGVGVEVVSVIQ